MRMMNIRRGKNNKGTKALAEVLVVLMLICLVACGGGTTGSSGGNSGAVEDPEKGSLSVIGGWKNPDLGVIWIIDQDGTGAMINEIRYNSDKAENAMPALMKEDITWEEDEETISVKTHNGDFTLQKKKDGSEEALEYMGVSYVRMSDTETKEYKEQITAVSSMEPPKVPDDSANEELVLDEPVTVIDNENVTVKFTRFFSEVMNKGTNNEWINAGFDIEVENKMESYEISLFPRDCSLSDRRVIEFAANGTNDVAAGKIATMSFTRSDHKAFDDLNAVYELEGSFDFRVSDDKHTYSDLGGKIAFSIPKTINADADAAAGRANREAFRDIYLKISDEIWLFNGGKDTVLNYVKFKEDVASVGQVYYDGNGIHDNGTNECPYEISDEAIVISMSDGSRLEIPYSASGDEIVLGEGSYLALSRVDEEIQGYWTATTHSDFTGGDSKYLILPT